MRPVVILLIYRLDFEENDFFTTDLVFGLKMVILSDFWGKTGYFSLF